MNIGWSTLRRTMKWLGLVICLCLTLLWGGSYALDCLHFRVGAYSGLICEGAMLLSRGRVGRPYLAIFPLWLLIIPVVAVTIAIWRFDRRPPKGHCQTCGYNLTGNVSGVCPECGETV